MLRHFNSSRAMVLLQPGWTKNAIRAQTPIRNRIHHAARWSFFHLSPQAAVHPNRWMLRRVLRLPSGQAPFDAPLGLALSLSVFLAAIAQRTRKLRFGPLVWAAGRAPQQKATHVRVGSKLRHGGDVSCKTAFPPKAEAHPRSWYVEDVPSSGLMHCSERHAWV